MTAHIDPIKVREERERIAALAQAMQGGAKAADALLWFAEYAGEKDITAVLTAEAKLVAGATPNAQHAQAYVTQAARAYAVQILGTAMSNAQADFSAAERMQRARS